MKKTRKLNKLKVSITIFLIVFVITTAVFGRYIYNGIKETYLSAKQFYFTSDILTVNGAKYEYYNWGGIDTYPIEVELYSYSNKLEKLDYDLNYTFTCESLSTDKIACSVGSETGDTSATGAIKVSENNTKRIIVYVKPIAKISKDETVKLKITASTEEPYQKQLSCEISLKIKSDVTYSIEDIVNRDYAVLKLVNENDSATSVNLKFNPEQVILDLNDEMYQEMTVLNTTTIDGKTYVAEVKFDLLKESTKEIKFYKVDSSKDYTYPKGDTTSVVTVNI